MRTSVTRAALFAAFCLAALPLSPASAQDVILNKAGAAPTTLTAETLKGLPRVRLEVNAGSGVDVYEGPALSHLMREAGIPVGPRAHRDPMRGYLVVRGADGYRVVVSAAEADKELHQGGIILADTLNGAPLPDAQGPWRLVVDGDLRPWRSVRQVVSIDYRLAD